MYTQVSNSGPYKSFVCIIICFVTEEKPLFEQFSASHSVVVNICLGISVEIKHVISLEIDFTVIRALAL